MAVDGFIAFKLFDNTLLAGESTIAAIDPSPLTDDISIIAINDALKVHGLFQIDDYSLDVVQTLNIGSQSTGAGAGKIAFNPFRIVRTSDLSSPRLFEMSCSGTPFKFVSLCLRKPGGGTKSGFVYLRFDFKLVAVKTMAWADVDGVSKETILFDYGGLQLRYAAQNPDGSFRTPAIVGGWNRVRNVLDETANPLS